MSSRPKKNKSKSLSNVKPFEVFYSSGGQKKNGIRSRKFVSGTGTGKVIGTGTSTGTGTVTGIGNESSKERKKKKISFKAFSDKIRQSFRWKSKTKKNFVDGHLKIPDIYENGASKSSVVVHENVIDEACLRSRYTSSWVEDFSDVMSQCPPPRLPQESPLLNQKPMHFQFRPHIFPPSPPPFPPPRYTNQSGIEYDGDDEPGMGLLHYKISNEMCQDEVQRIDKVAKKIDEIANKVNKEMESEVREFSTDSIKRRSSTFSLADLAETLPTDLTYSNFKTHLNKEISRSNDELLNQIAFAFSVVSSAINQATHAKEN